MQKKKKTAHATYITELNLKQLATGVHLHNATQDL
jgi:hypothetical protein